ncbi:MAG: mechanosensitive ion channel family protein [Deltaproteobacteria bacterium]|nr:mechanosensitive ion channel family protein [Deltaproteobacteria bacterium]
MNADLWFSVMAFAGLACVAVAWRALRGRELGSRFSGALGFFAIAEVLAVVLPWLPQSWIGPMRAVTLLAVWFGLVRAAVVSVDLLARRRSAHFSTIFLDLITLVLYGFVVLGVAGGVLGMEVTPLLATSALVTAVIGLALQETLGNVFSGLALQVQKPFSPGDWIRFGAYLGRVQGIGWRSTQLLTRSLELLEVPNAMLAKDVIVNYRGNAIGDELFVGVAYDTPPNRTKDVILGVLDQCPNVAKMPQPEVQVAEYGDFAIKYRIHFWILDYARQDLVRDAIMTGLWYAFRRHGIEIPYPIRVLQQRDGRALADAASLEQERVAALRQVDFLSELDDDDLAVLSPWLRPLAFGRGELVCREGEAGDTFFVLLQGDVEVVARGAADGETHVADLRAPAFFGEMSLLTDEPRSATVRATSDIELLIVAREGFERLFKSRPSVAAAISRALAERQSGLRDRLEQAHVETVERRSHRLLARMHAILRF